MRSINPKIVAIVFLSTPFLSGVTGRGSSAESIGGRGGKGAAPSGGGILVAIFGTDWSGIINRLILMLNNMKLESKD